MLQTRFEPEPHAGKPHHRLLWTGSPDSAIRSWAEGGEEGYRTERYWEVRSTAGRVQIPALRYLKATLGGL